MTDEGMVGQPMDAVEAAEAQRNFAQMIRAQFDGYVEAGFTESQALALCREFVRGFAAGTRGDAA